MADRSELYRGICVLKDKKGGEISPPFFCARRGICVMRKAALGGGSGAAKKVFTPE